jgi:hypothetical protein
MDTFFLGMQMPPASRDRRSCAARKAGIYAAADGHTQAGAISNLEETFAVPKEAYAEERLPVPEPNPELQISVAGLSALSHGIKASRLAESSRIPGRTLATKPRRGTELSAD